MMGTLPETVSIIILAAGKGTRMKSDKAKVLHTICGQPMILYVVETAFKVAGANIVMVVGHQADDVKKTVSAVAEVKFALQEKQEGTGHAVMCALSELQVLYKDVVILSGDVPLIKASTIKRLVEEHLSNCNQVTILAVKIDNPYGYGRLIMNKSGKIERIVEETDASESEKTINIINSGIYCVNRLFLESALSQIKTNNVQKELYLTDIIEIACKNNYKAGCIIGDDHNELMGVNTPEDLHGIESLLLAKRPV